MFSDNSFEKSRMFPLRLPIACLKELPHDISSPPCSALIYIYFLGQQIKNGV